LINNLTPKNLAKVLENPNTGGDNPIDLNHIVSEHKQNMLIDAKLNGNDKFKLKTPILNDKFYAKL